MGVARKEVLVQEHEILAWVTGNAINRESIEEEEWILVGDNKFVFLWGLRQLEARLALKTGTRDNDLRVSSVWVSSQVCLYIRITCGVFLKYTQYITPL